MAGFGPATMLRPPRPRAAAGVRLPIHCEFDAGKGRVCVRLVGVVADDELLRRCDALLDDPEPVPVHTFLIDHTQLENVASPGLVQQIVARLARLGAVLGPYRCAVVAPSPAAFGMARMAAALAERTPAQVRAFRTLDEAETWLAEERRSA